MTFPSTSNGFSFSTSFDTCVGGKYTFHVWYFVPKAYKNIQCVVDLRAFYAEDVSRQTVTVFDSWVEAKLDFVAGLTTSAITWSVTCLNQLQKMVVYLDDVSVTTR